MTVPKREHKQGRRTLQYFQVICQRPFQNCTNTDPGLAEGRPQKAMHFIIHPTLYIRKKLQLEAGSQTPLSILVEEAFKVYNNQVQAEEAKKEMS